MMITNKCKEDFLKWLNQQEIAPYAVMFDELPINVKIMYLMEFFDHHKIFIYENVILDIFDCEIKEYITLEGELRRRCLNPHDKRIDARLEAIEIANKIYNSQL